jgi:hypothetical protein
LPEALARTHHDSVLSRPARAPQRGERTSLARAIMHRLMSRPARTIAGAVLTAVLTGIVINALLLQKSHRIAAVEPPALTKSPAAAASPAPAPAQVQPAPESAPAPAPAPAQPPARPADLGALIDTTAAPLRSGDPIRDLIRTDSGGKDASDAKRLTIAAQTALIKLGFSIKADGVAGASTQQAIQQFERTHGLIPMGEITPKIVKLLTGAANAAH